MAVAAGHGMGLPMDDVTQLLASQIEEQAKRQAAHFLDEQIDKVCDKCRGLLNVPVAVDGEMTLAQFLRKLREQHMPTMIDVERRGLVSAIVFSAREVVKEHYKDNG